MKITKIKSTRSQRRKRVAAYARVSTNKENQQDSLEEQRAYYRSLITANPDYDFVGVYWDQESGTDAKHREGFQRMIQDALDEKIDLIYCKSVSRWARNLLDGQRYAQLLHSNGCDVYFEENQLNTSNPACSMMFGFMSTVAQDESRSISENTRWAMQKKVERGEYRVGNRVFGYSTVDGELRPNEDAEAVRFIFESFLNGMSMRGIARELERKGVKGTNGRPLSGQGVKYILQNEVYKGDRLLQKRAPRDFLTKKPDESRPYISNYLEADHEAIVSHNIWEQAQKKLAGCKRTGGQPHPLHGKIICGRCGATMGRKGYKVRNGSYKGWLCPGRKAGTGCVGRIVKEEEILSVMDESVDRVVVREDGLEVQRREGG